MQPSRRDVEQVLRDLIHGKRSRSEVSAWATTWLERDTETDDDDVVYETLTKLESADSPTSDREFLFLHEDFNDWLRWLESQS